MASKNIIAKGATYNGVESVTFPTSPSGTATFYEISDTTALASDVASGKYFYDSLGQLTQGTASGGGGSNWTFLATQEFTVSTTSTSNTSVGSITLTLSDYADPNTMLWIHIRDKAGKRAGYFYGSDTIFFHYQLANESTYSLSIRPVMQFYATSNNAYAGQANAYGVFGYRLYYDASNHYVDIYSRYSSAYGTIDGTFKCDVYKLTPPSGMTLFDLDPEE